MDFNTIRKTVETIPEWEYAKEKISPRLFSPKPEDPVWDNNLENSTLSSGSKISFEEYLNLRVLWVAWTNINEVPTSLRNNPKTEPKYTGLISDASSMEASKIFSQYNNIIAGYLDDIETNKDGTRPSIRCGVMAPTRYYQALVEPNVSTSGSGAKNVLKSLQNDPSIPFPGMSTASGSRDTTGLASRLSGVSISTPTRTSIGTPKRAPQSPFSPFSQVTTTPMAPVEPLAIGGRVNPPEDDESYVNTALLLLLQSTTMYIKELGMLDWLAHRLPLRMTRPQIQGYGSGRRQIMESRVDGYLCRRDSPENTIFNRFPLAILEAKASTRRDKEASIRWQESAEMACWVANLDDEHENIGLLQSSTSGRKRRLLISQNRHEIFLIIAEYGNPWKEYVQGRPQKRPGDQSQNPEDLCGSAATNAQFSGLEDHKLHISNARDYVPRPGGVQSTRSNNKKTRYAGPDYFCIMNQWGPFNTTKRFHMENFLRRIIALQIELLKH